MVVVLIWFTAIVSAFVDNIPMATVMVPVLLSLAETGMDPAYPDLGGVQGHGHRRHCHAHRGLGQRHRGGAGGQGGASHLPWKRYCKYAMPAAVLVLVVSMVLILALH